MKKTVLVSGGAGFIGSHVTVELVQAGYDVVIADNFSNCDETNYKGVCAILGREIPLVPMDFCDKAAVYSLFEKYPIDAVIHFAAFKAVGESMTEPLKYYRNNLLSFMNILDAAKHQGGCNVLFSSSATVYGQTDKLPVTEETPRQPAESPYGNTKTMCEDILRDSVKAYAGVRGIALRDSTVLVGYEVAERTTVGVAERLSAVHAACGLFLQLLVGEHALDLAPVARALLRRTVDVVYTLHIRCNVAQPMPSGRAAPSRPHSFTILVTPLGYDSIFL